MTELIVALDGPRPLDIMLDLAYVDKDNQQVWFKVGPQTLLNQPSDMAGILHRAYRNDLNIFLDLKWADTQETVAAAFKRARELGIAAVSTYTSAATRACISTGIAKVAVWQVHMLTDDEDDYPTVGSPGVICPGHIVDHYSFFKKRNLWFPQKIIVPGVRLPGENMNGHSNGCTTDQIAGKADFAVVGRPIWTAPDPISAAARYRRALRQGPCSPE